MSPTIRIIGEILTCNSIFVLGMACGVNVIDGNYIMALFIFILVTAAIAANLIL